MWTRRVFLRLGGVGAVGTAAFAARSAAGVNPIATASAAVADRTPEEVAQDEFYWREIQEAFTLDRTLSNLNNGNSCPAPRVVLEACKRYMDMANMLPVEYNGMLGRNIQTVKRRLAAEFGCEVDELALTRNASESLQIVQDGLDLKPGDEVITTDQDYPRMLTTWDQRARRDRIKITRIQFPVPTTQDDLYQRFERAITPQTKVLHFCHITNLTGQIFPVRKICDTARAKGVKTIVDGAHAFAHFPYNGSDLGCDFYGTSLHKWLLAPIGTGFLYVRRDNIEGLWGLQPTAASRAKDIRKFEEIGTHPAANHNAIAEALTFHEGIGSERKAARLRYLRDRWAKRLSSTGRFRIHTSMDPAQSCAICTVQVLNVDTNKAVQQLWDRWRIIATPINHAEYTGIRVTPNVYTTIEEIDTFAGAMEKIAG